MMAVTGKPAEGTKQPGGKASRRRPGKPVETKYEVHATITKRDGTVVDLGKLTKE